MYKPTPKLSLFLTRSTSPSVHQLALELSQSFVKNVDGSYSRFHCPEPPPEPELPDGFRTDRPQAIRPMELRTFLKVGECFSFSRNSTKKSVCTAVLTLFVYLCRTRLSRSEGGCSVCDRVDPGRPPSLSDGRAQD